MGHIEGDRALIDIANLLKNTFRKSDILTRLGGDEFAGLMLNYDEQAEEALSARIKETFDAFNSSGIRPYNLSISFGLAHYDTEKPITLDELLARGDSLMYKHKLERKLCRTTGVKR